MVAEHGDGEDSITYGHHYDTPYDGALVVLCAVGNDSARQSEHIYEEVKHREHDARHLVRDTELRADEQNQHGIHDVIAEALTHIAQGCRNKALGVFFPRFAKVINQEWDDNDDNAY